MNKVQGEGGYGIRLFKPGTPSKTNVRSVVFFSVLVAIILIQAFYYVFANAVEPLVLGMPFGMFFIVLFIAIEFVVLLILYYLEEAGKA